MRTDNDNVVRLGDEPLLLFRLPTPENEHDAAWLGIYEFDYSIRKPFPAKSSMGIGGVRSNRQSGIQHEHTLLCPRREATVVWYPTSLIIR